MNVLVLNASYEPLHEVSVKHAIKMLLRQVAVVEETHPDRLFGGRPVPRVLRLIRYVTLKWRYSRPAQYSRSNVLLRDGEACAYCGRHATTIDHVTPRSRGGKTDWLNTVAACGPCNARKADRTLAECGMRLRVTPYVPTIGQLRPMPELERPVTIARGA